jgi:NTP pyrophosphatase (non-canonical NTP hydrolase)
LLWRKHGGFEIGYNFVNGSPPELDINMDIHELTEKIEKISENYSIKYQFERDSDWFVLKLQEEVGELIQAYLMVQGKARQKGKSKEQIRDDFENEVADVLAHTLLLAKHFHVDLDRVFEGKWVKWARKEE